MVGYEMGQDGQDGTIHGYTDTRMDGRIPTYIMTDERTECFFGYGPYDFHEPPRMRIGLRMVGWLACGRGRRAFLDLILFFFLFFPFSFLCQQTNNNNNNKKRLYPLILSICTYPSIQHSIYLYYLPITSTTTIITTSRRECEHYQTEASIASRVIDPFARQ